MAKSSSRKPRQGQLSLLAPDRAGEPESEWADPLPDDFQCAEMRAYQTFVAREEEMGNLSTKVLVSSVGPE